MKGVVRGQKKEEWNEWGGKLGDGKEEEEEEERRVERRRKRPSFFSIIESVHKEMAWWVSYCVPESLCL